MMNRRRRCLLPLFFGVTILLAALILASGPTSGKEITVDDDGGADYTKIQPAVENASNGDIVRVLPGTYQERVTINNTISLVGSGVEATVIDAYSQYYGIKIQAPYVNVSGFTIQWGDKGIWVHSYHAHIFDNECWNGYTGIYLSFQSGVQMNRSTFALVRNNTCHSQVLGIDVTYFGHNIITGNNLYRNKRGIFLRETSKNEISGNRIWDNEEGIRAVSIKYSVIFPNTIFKGNVIQRNEIGMKFQSSTLANISENILSDNDIGILFDGYNMDHSIHDNYIHGNHDWGINTTGGITLNATGNWWGSDTGPFHSTDNPSGKGDSVTDYVGFDPWMSQPGDHYYPTATIDTPTPDSIFPTGDVNFKGHGLYYDQIIRYHWIIDGFKRYDGPVEEFTYDLYWPGLMNVTLEVQDNYGYWSDPTTIQVTIHERPKAQINYITPKFGNIIELWGQGTDDGSITNFSWRSDIDGELYFGPETTLLITNLSEGLHTMFLKVQDNHGAWSDEDSLPFTMEPDYDLDGKNDTEDAFPEDPAASRDTDGDGYPDNWNNGMKKEDSTTGLELDKYPYDPDNWQDAENEGFISGLVVSNVFVCFIIAGTVTTISRRKIGPSSQSRKES